MDLVSKRHFEHEILTKEAKKKRRQENNNKRNIEYRKELKEYKTKLEQDNVLLRAEIEAMRAMREASEKKIEAIQKVSEACMHFFVNGFCFWEPVQRDVMDRFKLGLKLETTPDGTITGLYNMKNVRRNQLLARDETKEVIQPILGTAQSIFKSYLGRDVEVELNSAAILTGPPPSYSGPPTRGQVMHADNLGFASISVIIMLSPEGGKSTHILNARQHGVDSTSAERDVLLQFDPSQLDATYNQRSRRLSRDNHALIRETIKNRYGNLLNLSPDEFFVGAQNKHMTYGEIEIFRSDLLHAGPSCGPDREVLFMEIRVKHETRPDNKDFQYRFPNLLKIAGASANEICSAKEVWSREGYFFPEDEDSQDDLAGEYIRCDESQLYEKRSELFQVEKNQVMTPFPQNGLFSRVDIPTNTTFAVFNEKVKLNDDELKKFLATPKVGDDHDFLCYLKKDVTLNCCQARRQGRCKASLANSSFNLFHANGRPVTANCTIVRGSLRKGSKTWHAYLRSTDTIPANVECVVDTYGAGYSNFLSRR